MGYKVIEASWHESFCTCMMYCISCNFWDDDEVHR